MLYRSVIVALSAWIAGAIAPAVQAAEPPPVIETMLFRPADVYCAFWQKGHRIGQKNHESWRYMLVTQHVPNTVRVTVESAFIRYDGRMRELLYVGQDKGGITRNRHYKTFGDDPATITLSLVEGKLANGQQTYDGLLRVERRGNWTIEQVTGQCPAKRG